MSRNTVSPVEQDEDMVIVPINPLQDTHKRPSLPGGDGRTWTFDLNQYPRLLHLGILFFVVLDWFSDLQLVYSTMRNWGDVAETLALVSFIVGTLLSWPLVPLHLDIIQSGQDDPRRKAIRFRFEVIHALFESFPQVCLNYYIWWKSGKKPFAFLSTSFSFLFIIKTLRDLAFATESTRSAIRPKLFLRAFEITIFIAIMLCPIVFFLTIDPINFGDELRSICGIYAVFHFAPTLLLVCGYVAFMLRPPYYGEKIWNIDTTALSIFRWCTCSFFQMAISIIYSTSLILSVMLGIMLISYTAFTTKSVRATVSIYGCKAVLFIAGFTIVWAKEAIPGLWRWFPAPIVFCLIDNLVLYYAISRLRYYISLRVHAE